MPVLRPKHEHFCRSYVQCHTASEAALEAGYSAAGRHKQAYRLMRRPGILARIAELRAEIAERECRSEAALLAKLEADHQQAARAGKPLWAAQIVKMQAALPALLAHAPRAGAGGDGIESLRAALTAMAKQLGVALPAPSGAK